MTRQGWIVSLLIAAVLAVCVGLAEASWWLLAAGLDRLP